MKIKYVVKVWNGYASRWEFVAEFLTLETAQMWGKHANQRGLWTYRVFWA